VNIIQIGHILTGNQPLKKIQCSLVKRQIWISCHLALDTSIAQVELLFILSGKNPDRLLSSIKIYHKNKHFMPLCGQFKKGFEGGATSCGQVYICSSPWAGAQPESFSMGQN